MNPKTSFKWRHYQSEIILLCMRWYLSYPLSYRQVAEIVYDRGIEVDHTTIYRWVQEYSSEIDKRIRPHLCLTNDSWRVEETYILVKGKQKYLYRAVDSMGFAQDIESGSHFHPTSNYCRQEPCLSKSYQGTQSRQKVTRNELWM
jgi:transposase-like protein